MTFAVLEALDVRRHTARNLALAALSGATLRLLRTPGAGRQRRKRGAARRWSFRPLRVLSGPAEAALAMALLGMLSLPFVAGAAQERSAAPVTPGPGTKRDDRASTEGGDGDGIDFEAAIASW